VPERAGRSTPENRRYVVGIASHKLADAYRARGRFDDLDDANPAASSRTPFRSSENDRNPGEVLCERQLFQAVRDLIAAQPSRRRLVGSLFFIEAYSQNEIAAILEMSSSTVRTHVERLRPLLQDLINRWNGTAKGGEPS
jgi:DNA-directed RNA polymerase specialized sigma24 family protein